jgi:hypothetical protein
MISTNGKTLLKKCPESVRVGFESGIRCLSLYLKRPPRIHPERRAYLTHMAHEHFGPTEFDDEVQRHLNEMHGLPSDPPVGFRDAAESATGSHCRVGRRRSADGTFTEI